MISELVLAALHGGFRRDRMKNHSTIDSCQRVRIALGSNTELLKDLLLRHIYPILLSERHNLLNSGHDLCVRWRGELSELAQRLLGRATGR